MWKPVLGYEGSYQVSDEGQIKSIARHVPTSRPRHTYNVVPARTMKADYSGRYARVYLSKDGVRKRVSVHVVVLEAFIGPRPEGMVGCHNDGNTQNNRLTNLRWDTVLGNEADKYVHKTRPFGRATNVAVLNEDLVRKIRLLARRGLGCTVIAKRIGCCSEGAVSHVLSGRTWSRVQ